MPKVRFILYLKPQRLISKRFLYYLVHVKDSSSEGLSLQSIPVVYDFSEVFLMIILMFLSIGKFILGLIFFPTLILSPSLTIEWLRLSLKNLRRNKRSSG